ncbi:MAG: hypothetical protein ABSG25_04175 [Bryobacteraceae bacterium]
MKYTIVKTCKNRVIKEEIHCFEHTFIINVKDEIRFYSLTFPQTRYLEGDDYFINHTNISEFKRTNAKQEYLELDDTDIKIFEDIKFLIAKEL